jgi:hypothetical protein
MLSLSATCSYVDKNEAIVRRWKLILVELPIKETTQDSLSPLQHVVEKIEYGISYEFKKDKTYIIRRGTQTDTGEWSISSDEKVLVLHSAQSPKENAEFQIEELNQYRLAIIAEEKGKVERLIFE